MKRGSRRGGGGGRGRGGGGGGGGEGGGGRGGGKNMNHLHLVTSQLFGYLYSLSTLHSPPSLGSIPPMYSLPSEVATRMR